MSEVIWGKKKGIQVIKYSDEQDNIDHTQTIVFQGMEDSRFLIQDDFLFCLQHHSGTEVLRDHLTNSSCHTDKKIEAWGD